MPNLYDHVEGLQVFRKLLEDDTKLLIFANAPYDLGVFCAEDPTLLPWVFRALLEERIVDILTWQRLFMIKHGTTEFDPYLGVKVTAKYYSLGNLTQRWLGEHVAGKAGDDAWRFRFAELFGTPIEQWPEEAKQYAALDAAYTVRVWQVQHQQEGMLPDFWRKVRQNWALHLVSCRGLRTDEVAVRELEHHIHEHVDEAMRQLLEVGIYRLGGTKRAPKLVKTTAVVQARVEAAFRDKGLPPPMTEPSEKFPQGQVKTDDETLQETGDPDLMLLAEIGADQKLLSTYVPRLLQGTQWPINPHYTVPVDSGRSSSWDPNIQNQPRKHGVRECFVPRTGFVFVDADYNIAELRSLAQCLLNMYGYSRMAESILDGDKKGKGYDIHCYMAAAIMQIDIDSFAARFRAGDKQCKDMRQMAKGLDFGAPGGLGADTLVAYVKAAYGIIMPVEDAKYYIELYKQTFPEMEQFFIDIGAQVGRGGEKTTVVQHGSSRVRGGLRFCAACNTYFQGLTADGALDAMWRVAAECYLGFAYESDEQYLRVLRPWTEGQTATWLKTPLYGCYPIWFIHDQIGIEAPFAVAREAAARLSVVMCEAMNVFTPDVPAVAEADMKRRWYKDAEPAFDADKQLVPWAPTDPREKLLALLDSGQANATALQRDYGRLLDPDVPYWTDEEAAWVQARHGDPKTDWILLNKFWRLEMRARETNPDPWCA